MLTNVDRVVQAIGDKYAQVIAPDSRFYMEVSIGKEAEQLGLHDVKNEYPTAQAVVPLKTPLAGMKVRIDGRTFVKYAQYDEGVAVPGYVAKKAGRSAKPYEAQDSMILVFH